MGFSLNFGHLAQAVSDHPWGKSDWVEDALPLATFQGFEAAAPPSAKFLAADVVLFLLLCLWNFGAVFHRPRNKSTPARGLSSGRKSADLCPVRLV